MTERMDINRVLLEMRSLKSQVQSFNGTGNLAARDTVTNVENNTLKGPSFSDVMSSAVNKVNNIQHESGRLARGYIQGEEGIDITDVMIASQKSSVAFQAMTQVRNKVVEAYRDVMNMPI